MSWIVAHLWLVGSTLGVGGLAALGFAFPGIAVPLLTAAGAWLSRRSLSEIGVLLLGIALIVDHLEVLRSHREAVNWHNQFTAEHQARQADHAAFDQTVANYRAAAATAKAADAANAARVHVEQGQITREQSDELQSRLAAVRAYAERLRAQLAAGRAHPGGSAGASVPGVPAAVSGPAQAAGEDGFSLADRLTASEQAIQLDELIKWVKRQAAVTPSANAPERPKP